MNQQDLSKTAFKNFWINIADNNQFKLVKTVFRNFHSVHCSVLSHIIHYASILFQRYIPSWWICFTVDSDLSLLGEKALKKMSKSCSLTTSSTLLSLLTPTTVWSVIVTYTGNQLFKNLEILFLLQLIT